MACFRAYRGFNDLTARLLVNAFTARRPVSCSTKIDCNCQPPLASPFAKRATSAPPGGGLTSFACVSIKPSRNFYILCIPAY